MLQITEIIQTIKLLEKFHDMPINQLKNHQIHGFHD